MLWTALENKQEEQRKEQRSQMRRKTERTGRLCQYLKSASELMAKSSLMRPGKRIVHS